MRNGGLSEGQSERHVVKEPVWGGGVGASINWIHVKIKLVGEPSEGSNAFI